MTRQRLISAMLFGALFIGCDQTSLPQPPLIEDAPAPITASAEPMNRPIAINGHGYVTSQKCKACHEHEYNSWHESYHRRMTQVATPQAVVGDFDGFETELDGRRYQFERRGDKFFVNAIKDGKADERQVVLTTGSHHLQAYWIATGETRTLFPLPFTWMIDEQRWAPNRSTFLNPPNAKVEQQTGRWNRNCLKCHVTHGQPRIDGEMTMDTRVAEFGIACEACHGPGEQHAQDEAANSIVQPALLSHERSAQVCGQCHSLNVFRDGEAAKQFNFAGASFRPGDDLDEHSHVISGHVDDARPRSVQLRERFPTMINELYWPDGMVRVTGREYSGLIESPCYRRGEMDCISCHQLHKPRSDERALKAWANDQLKTGMDTNQACLQCHEDMADNIAEHTYHAAQSTGSQCYNCHMPHTTYGLLGAIRSHMITSPSVRESTEFGRPNACNHCHLDRTLEWTAKHLAKWYGQEEPLLTDDQKTIPAAVLWLVSGDAGQRALSVWACGWEAAREASGTAWMAPYLIHLLADPYDAVRFMAIKSLRSLPGYEQTEYDYVAPVAMRKMIIDKLKASAPTDPQAAERIDHLHTKRDDRPVILQE